jgi:hypothetical protein
MPIGDQDLDIFFQDGSTVTLADKSTFKAHFDLPEMVEQFGSLKVSAGDVAGRPTIRFATKNRPASVKNGTLVTVDGVQYKVRHVEREGDGLVSIAHLQNP